MAAILFIGIIVGMFALYQSIAGLTRRVDALERTTGTRPATPRAAIPEAPAPPPADGGAPVFVPPVPTPGDATFVDRLVDWVKEDFMMKLGAFLMLCALGWFVSYAFMHNLIGPAGRIMLGLIAGAGFLAWGYARIRTHVHQGGVLLVVGSTTILMTTFAARALYDFFPPFVALAIMFLSVAFVALVSVMHDRRSLALTCLILAALAPYFTADPGQPVVSHLLYLLVIVLGALTVVYFRGWSSVTLGALIVVVLETMPYFGSYIGATSDYVLLFGFVFVAIFFAANLLGFVVNDTAANRLPHLMIGAGSGLYLLFLVGTLAEPEWRSLLYVAWMLVFSLGSFIAYRFAASPYPFWVYGGTSIALLAAATAEELTGPALTIAYTVEVTSLVLAASMLMKRDRLAAYLSTLFVIPVIMSIESTVSPAWQGGVFHEDFLVLLITIVSLSVCGAALYERRQDAHTDTAGMDTVLMMTAGVLGIAWTWLVIHAGDLFSYDTATLITLVLYTIVGLFLLREAATTGHAVWKYAGGALIALVVARLLFIEVWNMDIAGRIVTFFSIGALLLSTAFKKRAHDQVTPTV